MGGRSDLQGQEGRKAMEKDTVEGTGVGSHSVVPVYTTR